MVPISSFRNSLPGFKLQLYTASLIFLFSLSHSVLKPACLWHLFRPRCSPGTAVVGTSQIVLGQLLQSTSCFTSIRLSAFRVTNFVDCSLWCFTTLVFRARRWGICCFGMSCLTDRKLTTFFRDFAMTLTPKLVDKCCSFFHNTIKTPFYFDGTQHCSTNILRFFQLDVDFNSRLSATFQLSYGNKFLWNLIPVNQVLVSNRSKVFKQQVSYI